MTHVILIFQVGYPFIFIRKAALKMRAGGVGYYPNSNFVHIDTGPVRKW
ncbi:DUF882 domain-containing protein [Arsenophonus endosymbiont of Aphis craccivora]|nr:DUF882 domain-containing protein [Arsenophonus endosymbiont of Aphis craccivora]